MAVNRSGRFLVLLASVVLAVGCWGQDRYDPHNYKPKEFPNAENHLQVQFLPPERDWERVDIYTPKDAGAGPLPCVIVFYGGGWGGKVIGGLSDEMKALLDRGYVVAMPDYVLRASQPVPMTIWDGAAAVRFLRANAEKYRIDPERIGAWGFSAGGWLVQHLGPSDAATLCPVPVKEKTGRQRGSFFIPMLEPHPLLPEQSAELQAIVTDWGAGVLARGSITQANPNWLSSDDPPLLTCHNDPTGKFPPGPQALLDAGTPVEVAYLDVKNTHVPSSTTPTTDKAGNAVTWRERILQFFDEYVKNPKAATPPEFFPHGGAITGATPVTIRTVHRQGDIHYTTDGSMPTTASALYTGPITVQPGTTLKAIVIKPGLEPSRVTAAAFHAGKAAPVITTTQTTYTARKGQPFSVKFTVESPLPVQWFIAGKLGMVMDKTNPPKEIPWLTMDPQTGELSGTPTDAGVCVFIVTANAKDGDDALCDAKSVIVTVTE